jgi:hypothetical protein
VIFKFRSDCRQPGHCTRLGVNFQLGGPLARNTDGRVFGLDWSISASAMMRQQKTVACHKRISLLPATPA